LANKPQQQTLSLRISDGMRQRLERARQLMSSKTGEIVSTSEIAKQLLESAREERMEVVDLMADPTETLLQIRRKGEAEHILSKAEWTILAHFVQQGLEAFSSDTPSPVSRESLVAVLDAFLAVYDLRKASSKKDDYYLGNMPSDCRTAKGKGAEGTEKATPEIVRRTLAEARRRLSEPAAKCAPLLAGRNLYILLEEENLGGADGTDRVLRPYWPILWRLAARGHYYVKKEPIREKFKIAEEIFKAPIPPVTEGGFTLSFERGEGNDFALLLSFPGIRPPQYPIGRYPTIAEFRLMLAALGQETTTTHWNGEYFFALRGRRDGETEFSFGARGNGITFTLSEKEWTALRKLFRRAWQMPEVRLSWDVLTLEYGEL
jgi:hypothetical protein